MTSLEDALYTISRRAACLVMSGADSAYGLLGAVGDGLSGRPNQLARNLSRQFCGDPGPPDPDPPFTGGQCEGVTYNVTASGSSSVPGPGTMEWNGVVGPVGGLVPQPAGSNDQFRRLLLSTGDGLVPISGGQALIEPDDVSSWSIDGVVRVDGQLDNCGNPLPDIPTGQPIPPETTNITYENYEGDVITTNVNLTFAPVWLDVDGSVNVPVEFNLDADVNLTGNLNLSGNVEVGFGGGGLTPSGTLPPAEGPPPPETRRCIVAAYVELGPTEAATATVLFRDGSDELYVPRIGTAFFTAELGGELYRSQGIDLKKTETLIEAPREMCYTGLEVAVEPGVDLNFAVPLYRPREVS